MNCFSPHRGLVDIDHQRSTLFFITLLQCSVELAQHVVIRHLFQAAVNIWTGHRHHPDSAVLVRRLPMTTGRKRLCLAHQL
eukprot:7838224-Karenia_brevis.AAC.1